MKKRLIYSTLALFVFALLGGGSVSWDDFVAYIIMFVSLCVVGFILSFFICSKKDEKEAKERMEKEKKEKEEFEKDQNEFIERNDGIPDITIPVGNRYSQQIHCYESRDIIFLNGRKYNFSQILDFSVNDSARTQKGEITAVTGSNTGSMVGRALVGGALAGSTGAIIGGATGKKETKYTQGDDVVIHNYAVVININSIASPIVRVVIGPSEDMKDRTVGLLNVIINKNKGNS